MTPGDLARVADIRARADAATEGPWFGGSQNRRKDGIGIVGVGQGDTAAPIAVLAGARQTIKDRAANTAFIAAARADVPWLLDRLAAETERADVAEATVAALRLNVGALRQAFGLDDSDTWNAKRMNQIAAQWETATAERDAALARLARVEALFAGDPDTSCRTRWEDGVECVSVPLDDLRAALSPAEETP